MEAHDEHIQAFDLDIDVQLPQGRTASAKPISVNTHPSNTRNTVAPPHRRKAMNSDGGSIMGRAAFVALDTRVILGALLGWSLVSKVLKRWNNKNEDARSLVGEMETTAEFSSLRTPHASILETEVKSLRKSLQELRVDNLVLAAQVAALHGGISSRSQRSAAPSGGKALNDAFEAAATSAIRAAPRIEPYSQPSTSLPAAVLVENDNIDNQISEQRKRDEMVLLQQENEELRLALEQLRLENEEMAERMLEVAFTGAGVAATINEPVNEMNDLNQLGELRNALIAEAGGVLEATEEDALWLELASSDKEPEDLLLSNDSSSSVLGGPTTPELANEGGEPSQQGWQRHIPAAAYLED